MRAPVDQCLQFRIGALFVALLLARPADVRLRAENVDAVRAAGRMAEPDDILERIAASCAALGEAEESEGEVDGCGS